MKDFGFIFEQEIVKNAKPAGSGEFSVWAYASTYDIDSDDCQITRTALEAAKDDLIKYNTVLFNHNYERPVGRVVETKIDNKGLLVRIIISATETDLIGKIQDGTLSKLSISGRAMEWTETTPDADGRSVLQITKIKLFEVSIVSVPANVEAKTISSSIVKSIFLAKMKDEDTQKSLLADLQLLAGRLSGDDKSVIDSVLEFFKTTQNSTMEKKITNYSFSDTNEARPIFQLNSVSDSPVELSEANTFRKQLLKKGKWFHWAGDNGVLELTDEKIDEIIKNFKANVVESVPVPLTHTNDPSKNTGHVVDLIKTEEGLDAVIEIKDLGIVEKIKSGLITAISASFDPNYMMKKTKEFTGAVLLHAALVAEPYIKGMGKFVALSDEFDGREVIQLEDSEFDVQKSLNTVFDLLKNIQEHVAKKEPEKSAEEIQKEKDAEEIEKKKHDGDKCKLPDGSEGYMEDGKCVNKAKKSIEDEKSSEEAAGETKVEPAKSAEAEKAKGDVVLADSEKLYDKYLQEGKVVPAGKSAFIALCDMLKTIQLADSSVDVSKKLEEFLTSQPKIVSFEENGTVEDPTKEKPGEVKVDTIPEDVKDFYMNKMNLSEEDAIAAWKDAQDSHTVKDTQKSTLFG